MCSAVVIGDAQLRSPDCRLSSTHRLSNLHSSIAFIILMKKHFLKHDAASNGDIILSSSEEEQMRSETKIESKSKIKLAAKFKIGPTKFKMTTGPPLEASSGPPPEASSMTILEIEQKIMSKVFVPTPVLSSSSSSSGQCHPPIEETQAESSHSSDEEKEIKKSLGPGRPVDLGDDSQIMDESQIQ